MFVIVTSVLSVENRVNQAADEAALITARTLDCNQAIEVETANDAKILTCDIDADHVYIEISSRFNNAQID